MAAHGHEQVCKLPDFFEHVQKIGNEIALSMALKTVLRAQRSPNIFHGLPTILSMIFSWLLHGRTNEGLVESALKSILSILFYASVQCRNLEV